MAPPARCRPGRMHPIAALSAATARAFQNELCIDAYTYKTYFFCQISVGRPMAVVKCIWRGMFSPLFSCFLSLPSSFLSFTASGSSHPGSGCDWGIWRSAVSFLSQRVRVLSILVYLESREHAANVGCGTKPTNWSKCGCFWICKSSTSVFSIKFYVTIF